jgi:glycerophosphoryl diester phosphodiesterase
MFDRARANGMSINTWTVNKEEDIRKMIELGVDQITSDYPLLVRQLLQEMGVKEKKAR